MNFMLTLEQNNYIYSLAIVLLYMFLASSVFISYIITKKNIIKEFNKVKNHIPGNMSVERLIVFIFCITASVMSIYFFANLTDIAIKYVFNNTMKISNIFINILMIINAVLISSYVALAPRQKNIRIINVSDKDSPTLLKKIQHMCFVTITLCIFNVIFSTLHNNQYYVYCIQLLLSLLLMAYHFVSIYNNKLFVNSLRIESTKYPFFSSKVSTFFNNKIAHIYLISMIAIIGYSYDTYKVQTEIFFIISQNILCSLLLIFTLQYVTSYIVNKTIRYLNSINKLAPLKSLEHRKKNIYFICNTLTCSVYLCAFYIIFSFFDAKNASFIFTKNHISIVVILCVSLIIHKGFAELKEHFLEINQSADNKQYQKVMTFIPTLHVILCSILFFIASMMVLTNFGLNITPILTTFGLFGATFALAAQDIIKSFLQGILLLIEKNIYVGDEVDLGNGITGAIERLSVRTMYVRNANGALHTIPYAAISIITNYSKDFSYQANELIVDISQNTEDVINILKNIISNMRTEEKYKDLILADLDIFGIKPFDSTNVKIAWGLKTMPDRYKFISLDIYKRLLTEFQKKNIQLPITNIKMIK